MSAIRKRLSLLLLLCGWISILPAQNLILNPGFEEGASRADRQFPLPTPDLLSLGVEDPFRSLPGSVFGRLQPYEGRSAMGISVWSLRHPDFREYIFLELMEPLVAGDQYTFSFFVANGLQSTGTAGGYGIEGLGVCFSETPFGQEAARPIEATPGLVVEDILYSPDWKRISFSFVAEAPYLYLAVGNFFDDANTRKGFFRQTAFPGAYYFFDSFELEAGEPILPPFDAPLPKAPEGEAIPTEEYGCDLFIPNVFSPDGNAVNDYFEVYSSCVIRQIRMEVYDRSGQPVFSSSGTAPRWDGLGASPGVYFYFIEAVVGDLVGDRLERRSGSITLVRGF